MTVKNASKSTNPTLDTYFKLHIEVYLVALKVHLTALEVTKGEGVLQYWPLPETCWPKPTIPCAVPELHMDAARMEWRIE